MKRYYLGLDNGGTATKAAIIDDQGKEIAVASMETAMLTPQPHFVERDMEEMWEANCAVIRAALTKADIRPEQIKGVGICGHGKGLYLWGKDDKPARNGIISTDNRAYGYVHKWREDGTEDAAFQRSCQHVMACQPVALLAWLKDNEPEVLDNVQWVFACKDYVRFRLTDVAMAEITDYSGTSLLNLHTKNYDEELLSMFGISAIQDALPPLCNATDLCGTVSFIAAQACGLVPGTPVIGGMFDINACALAVNVTNPDNICMIAGTWSINEYLRSDPVTDGRVLMNSIFCLPQYYLVEESSPTSAGNSEWYVRQMLPEVVELAKKEGKSIYSVLEDWVGSIAPESHTPLFLPFLMASNAHPCGTGTWLDLNVSHTRKHLARSIYEGIVFSHRYHLEKLLSTKPQPPKTIRLAGGAARSTVWAQMFADCLGLPVETVAANETGALGCAIATAAATNQFPSVAEAADHMCAVEKTFYPQRENQAIYDKKYSRYLTALDCLQPYWSQDL